MSQKVGWWLDQNSLINSNWDRKLIRSDIRCFFPSSLFKVEGYLAQKLPPSVWLWQWRIGGQKRNKFSPLQSASQFTSSIKRYQPEFRPLIYSLLVFYAKLTGALKTFQRSPHWGFSSISSFLQIILQIFVVHDLHLTKPKEQKRNMKMKRLEVDTQNCISLWPL